MNSRGFPSGLFMLDRLSHLKGGVPAGGGGLLPAWHYINYIVYFFHPVRRPPPLRSSPFQAGQSIRFLLHQYFFATDDINTTLWSRELLALEVVDNSLCGLCLLCELHN